MLIRKNILLVGGATRNVGKTTLICRIISDFSGKNKIIAIKIKTIRANDNFFHGKDHKPLIGDFRINKEDQTVPREDTQRMLKAGAKDVYMIKSKQEFLADAFKSFEEQIPQNSLIVCESNSLREFCVPAAYLLIKFHNSNNLKPSARELEQFADKIIYTDGYQHDFDMCTLAVDDTNWILSASTPR